MSEPAKANPKTSKRSKRRPAMEPLGWDEIVSQPGMGGYLSFLNGPVPLPHLQGPGTALATDPGAVSDTRASPPSEAVPSPDVIPSPADGSEISPVGVSGIISTPAVVSGPIPTSEPGSIRDTDPVLGSEVPPSPVVTSDPEGHLAAPVPAPESPPGVVTIPPIAASPGISGQAHTTPEVVLIPAITAIQRLRIRRCSATHDGHSLGEEVLYQALWKAAQPESGDSRTIVIGWRGMSQLCRMTPKNCKINTQRLIRKLALEILSPYNTPESIGTTYRVHSDQNILQRRREAGLEWVVRSRGVDFVDPATGASIMPICAHTP